METIKVTIPGAALRRATLKRKRRGVSEPVASVPTDDLSEGEESSVDTLKWRPVARSNIRAGFDDAAVLAFEEIDGVDVHYEEVEGGGRIAKLSKKAGSGVGSEKSLRSRTIKKRRVSDTVDYLVDDFNDENLPGWSHISLLPVIKRSLHSLSFSNPTDIQSRTLPLSLKGKDIVGVAETGSGKTLAYGLPIIQHVLASRTTPIPSEPEESSHRDMKALILAPTRELALQVVDHLRAMVPQPTPSSSGSRPPPPVSVSAVVGGMSSHKQRRILERGVDILVATPGRLWDIIQEDDSIALQIRGLRFLVLDEADRMIEAGHYQELDIIIKLTLRPGQKDEETSTHQDPEFAALEREAGLFALDVTPNEALQTFVYSATLSKDLQKNLSRRSKISSGRKKNQHPPSTLDELLLRLDFRDSEPEVIDLSPEGGAVSTLQESKIECLANDKDLYLYYFLLRYPGRSLVFVSSIDGIRRIMPLLEILQLSAFPLHSQLQQKQRLKNLDRHANNSFKASSNGVLVATDVAARGLDIPSVDHVVHYQMPRSADIYVHRNGRTARAKREGFSLQLCAPDERKVARALLHSLRREEDVPELSVDHDILSKLKDRVALARQIDNVQHNVKKENHNRNWLKETAEALDIELDADLLGNGAADDDDDAPRKARERSQTSKKQQAKVASMKAQLKAMIAQPLIARGISARYLTSGTRSVVEDLITSSNHSTMFGIKNNPAQKDVLNKKAIRHKLHRQKI